MVCVNVGKRFPLVKLNLAIVQYNPATVEPKLRPTPDQCRFVSSSDLQALGKKEDLLEVAEQFMKESRLQVDAYLRQKLSTGRATKLIRQLETNVVRLLLGRTLPQTDFVPGVTGKLEGITLVFVCYYLCTEPGQSRKDDPRSWRPIDQVKSLSIDLVSQHLQERYLCCMEPAQGHKQTTATAQTWLTTLPTF